MKRFVTSITLGTLIFLLLGFLALSFIVNRNMEDKGDVDPSMLTFFHETYDENREQFRRLAALLNREFSDVEIYTYIVKSKVDSDLSINAVYIPAQNEAKKLIIMSSGVHGIEGFTGSAVQQYVMTQMLSGKVPQNMGLLLIHAINPFGFKYERRVSENNVDMNRNFHSNKDLFTNNNEGYAKIYRFLNPEGKVRAGYFRNTVFFMKTVYKIIRYSMQTLRQSTVQGQYEFDKGIFYGGKDFEPQKEWLAQLISKKTDDYEFVFAIDLHTGLGERGTLHYLPGYVQDLNSDMLLERLLESYTVDWPDTGKEFYLATGVFRNYLGSLISADKKYIRIAFEYGTLESQSMVGSIRSLQNIILENQGFHYGYENNHTEDLVKNRFREMFFPSSKIWRSQIMKQTSEILPILIDRYAELN